MGNGLLVTIRCLTYNHEPYIRQCLDGFVMQKTNFRFEAIVHDDASTDGTAAIIKEYAEKYPDIIKPIFEIENQYSKRDGSLTKVMNSYMHGKYIAICEGDDYWIDPFKLQKQVDVLEKDENIGLCYSKAHVYNQKTRKYDGYVGEKFINFKSTILKNPVVTLTAMYRKNLYDSYLDQIKPYDKQWLMGDYPLWLWIASQNSVYFIDEVTGVYRVLENSASHNLDLKKNTLFNESVRNIRLFFNRSFLKNEDLEIEINDLFYRENVFIGIKNFNRIISLTYCKKIVRKTIKDKLKLFLLKTRVGFVFLTHKCLFNCIFL